MCAKSMYWQILLVAATCLLAGRQAAAAPAGGAVAGVELAKLVIPGLQVSARSERAAEDGGLVWSYADSAGVVRVLVHLAVFADASAARRELDAERRGVSLQLVPAADATLGDLAFVDDAGKGAALVLATQANLAYSVNVLAAAPPALTATAIAGLLHKALVAGAPTFPAATVTMPPIIDARRGGAVHVAVRGGYPYKLRAEGGYVARGASGQSGPGETIVRPFAPGTVTVYATVVDSLARVSVAVGSALAK